jgi:hypothetical protein
MRTHVNINTGTLFRMRILQARLDGERWRAQNSFSKTINNFSQHGSMSSKEHTVSRTLDWIRLRTQISLLRTRVKGKSLFREFQNRFRTFKFNDDRSQSVLIIGGIIYGF